jgi:hypothetical protein
MSDWQSMKDPMKINQHSDDVIFYNRTYMKHVYFVMCLERGDVWNQSWMSTLKLSDEQPNDVFISRVIMR